MKVMLGCGGRDLLIGECAHVNGCDQSQMLADWAVLQSPPEESERLDRDTWDPPRCKDVVVGATHHCVKRKNRVTSSPQHDRLCDDGGETESDAGDMALPRHL
jgi:hypothetical protein